MKKRSKARLSLQRETLKQLQVNALQHVQGGAETLNDCDLSVRDSDCNLCGGGGAASADNCTAGCL